MDSNYTIRHAKPKDIASIIELCSLHAAYEQCAYDPNNKANRLSIDLFSKNPKLYCLVVEKDYVLLGYATYMKQYATWDAKEYIYMDCLFIRDFARGSGIGEKLITQIREEAKKMGCLLIQWQTPTFNTKAIKFYRRIGAKSKSKERFFLNSNGAF